MKTRWLIMAGRHALFAVLAVLGFAAARADDADPPGRVARLSDAEGSVSLQPAGVQDWTTATVNRPLTTGDKLWTDQGSRAELDVGGLVIRLGATTGFSFVNLDDNTAQMQITAGTLIVRVRDMQAAQTYEVDTPNVALSLQQPGEYRVEVSDAGDATIVKVSQGQAQASGGGQSVAIGTQQMVSFSGTDTLTMDGGTLGAPDDLDSWSAGRERQLQDSPSRQYVAEDVAGTQDLDQNGRWENSPDYGYVWTPTAVAVGWVPYRFGQWVWIAPWGWTWVDDAPWGYAPFHYGRWVTANNSWYWVPGPRRVRPVYAPALVAWVGAPTAGVVIGANVGWFPLAPREVYVPAYRVSPTYVRNVNVTNTTIVNNTYITNVYQNNVTNIRYANNTTGAVTAVPQNVFSSGQRVGARNVGLSREALQGATVSAATPAIVPARQSVLGPNAGRTVARPPAALVNRPVMARTPPPRAPAPFDRQVAAMQENGGRPLARAELQRLQPASSPAPVHVIAGGGAVVNAATLPRNSRPATVAPGGPGGSASLADRERILQNSRTAPAPRVQRPAVRDDVPSAPGRASQYSPGQPWRSDRPPSAPLNHPPAAAPPQPYTRPAEIQSQQERYRGPPPAAVPPAGAAPPAAAERAAPPPPPVAHPAPPPPPPPKNEARDGGPHSDRTSRDRADR